MSVEGRIALVAGTGSVRSAIVQSLTGAGAKVAVVDDSRGKARWPAGDVPQAVTVTAFSTDLHRADGAAEAVAETVDRLGGLDLLVTAFDFGRDEDFLEMKLEEWNRVVTANVTPVFLICQAAARHMAVRRYGRIVNVAARDWLGWSRRANYAAAKAAVVGFTRSIAWELVGQGITANTVAPGWIDDERAASLPEAAVRAALAMQPIPALGSPSDVAEAVVFLAADESSYLTGQTLYVDGGRSILSSLTA